MTGFWMVRAGKGGALAGDFEEKKCAAIGFRGIGDITDVSSLEQLRNRVRTIDPTRKAASTAIIAGMLFKFRSTMQRGDYVVSYDSDARQYLLGVIAGDYRFEEGLVGDYEHVRDVRWDGRVSRDVLSTSAKNTLGGVMTVFEPGDAVLRELQAAMRGQPAVESPVAENEIDEQVDSLRRDVIEKAHEFIKDRILELSPDDMEEFVAALLRAMGFKTKVSRKGADRGRDIIASPDGLGLEQPRIVVEVKHRQNTIGAPEVRGFLGGLRPSDRGLYVSTGGFTREANYEAERAAIPVTLVTLDDLADLVVEHYEGFDLDGRALLPLVRVYWPKG